jgi:acylaminoacyl-peptidase
MTRLWLLCGLLTAAFSSAIYGQSTGPSDRLEPIDVFELEYVSDPQVSPDGESIVYQRNFKDIKTDRNLANLWMVHFDGTQHRPLTTGMQSDYSPRWAPDGKSIVYLSNRDGSSQLYRRWLDTGTEAKLTNLTSGASNLSWSPDGRWIAFTMPVATKPATLVQLPEKPKGAQWETPPMYIDELTYRADGRGFLPASNTQIFLLSSDGGTPRQMTTGDFSHSSRLSWTPDSEYLLFSANHHEERDYEPNNSEIHELRISDGRIRTLTDRLGPDSAPTVSPDGQMIAYTGYDDQYLGYQISRLYVMDRDGANPRLLSESLDRQVDNVHWAPDGKSLYFQYDSEGNTILARIDLAGKITKITQDLGGLSLGRPYSGAEFATAKNHLAFTLGTTAHPADLAVTTPGGTVRRLTNLNDDLFQFKKIGAVEEIWYESSFDGRRIQGWICKPPDFDPGKKYPLILEIHGGPFANYGSRFSAEVQLYAAAGYVVLYTNPRGSSSYGSEFGNLIHHNYPSEDYDDLMSGVDAVIARGYIDTDNLFVTGGSGGGVLSSWIIGKTNRFRAAVVAKPVINWYSFVLHADNPAFFYRYWFPGPPWEHQDHYMARSPISLVGNVETPTMLLTGEQDYRTPMSETEQYYAALKIRKVPAAMVRVQGSGHGIANKPSNLMAKVSYVLGWFEKYRSGAEASQR